ncbi:MAG: DUF1186 domain-containing protein [Prochlorothrix sp.]
MPLEEILAALEQHKVVYQHEAVDAAMAIPEEITPHLLRLLEKVRDKIGTYVEYPRYFGHYYAAYLLAVFQEPQAHPLLLDLSSGPADLVDLLWNDTLTEDLCAIFVKTYPGSWEGLKALVWNPEANDYARVAALEAIQYLMLFGQIEKEDVIDLCKALLQDPAANGDNYLYSVAALVIHDVAPELAMAEVKQAYAQDLIDPMLVRLQDFRTALTRSEAERRQKLEDDWERKEFETVHDVMAWWWCFKSEAEREEADRQLKARLLAKKIQEGGNPIGFTPSSRPAAQPAPALSTTPKKKKKKKTFMDL